MPCDAGAAEIDFIIGLTMMLAATINGTESERPLTKALRKNKFF